MARRLGESGKVGPVVADIETPPGEPSAGKGFRWQEIKESETQQQHVGLAGFGADPGSPLTEELGLSPKESAKQQLNAGKRSIASPAGGQPEEKRGRRGTITNASQLGESPGAPQDYPEPPQASSAQNAKSIASSYLSMQRPSLATKMPLFNETIPKYFLGPKESSAPGAAAFRLPVRFAQQPQSAIEPNQTYQFGELGDNTPGPSTWHQGMPPADSPSIADEFIDANPSRFERKLRGGVTGGEDRTQSSMRAGTFRNTTGGSIQ